MKVALKMTLLKAYMLRRFCIAAIASCSPLIVFSSDSVAQYLTAAQLGIPVQSGCGDFQINQRHALLPQTLFPIGGSECGGQLRLFVSVRAPLVLGNYPTPWVSGKLSIFDVTKGYKARTDLCKEPENGFQNPKSPQLHLSCSIELVVAAGEVRYLLIDWVTKDLQRHAGIETSIQAIWTQSWK